MTDRFAGFPRSAAKSAGTLMAARALVQAAVLVAGVLVARALGPAGLGRYGTVLAVSSLTVAGAGSGIAALAVREVAARRVDRRAASTMMRGQLLLTSAIALLGSFLAGAALGITFGMQLLCAMASSVCTGLLALRSAFLVGDRQYREAAMAEGLAGVATIVATVVALALSRGLIGALAAVGIGQLCGALYASRARIVFSPLVDVEACSTVGQIRRSLPFVALGVASGGFARADVIALGLVATQREVGFYTAAYRFLGPFNLIASAFGSVFYQAMSARPFGSEDWEFQLRRARRYFMLLAGPGVVAGVALAPLLVTELFGPAYAHAVTPARLLLLSVLPLAFYSPGAHSLNASGYESVWVKYLVVGIAVDFALVVGMGRRLGAGGASTAWLVTQLGIMVAVSVGVRGTRRSGRTPRGPRREGGRS